MHFEAALCPSVEGVMFTARHAGRSVRCLILREALEQVFGADADPSSWLQAHQRHAATIERIACQRYVASPGPAVLLFRKRDFVEEQDEDEHPLACAHARPTGRGSEPSTTVSPWG